MARACRNGPNTFLYWSQECLYSLHVIRFGYPRREAVTTSTAYECMHKLVVGRACGSAWRRGWQAILKPWPQVWCWMGTTQRLQQNASNVDVGRPLVITSSYCCPVGTWRTWMSLSWMCSQTKWMPSLMCLVCLWCTRFDDIYTADLLWHYTTAALETAQRFIEELPKPNALGSHVCHGALFSLCPQTWHSWLPLWWTGDEGVAKEHTEARSQLSSIQASRPVHIESSPWWWARWRRKDEGWAMSCRGHVSKNALEQSQVWSARIVHM